MNSSQSPLEQRDAAKAAPHPRQHPRLEALHSFGILDTPAESDFDDIVALASAICDTPISLISLVDEDRQWFKARVGTETEETGLDRAICGHAVLEDDLLEIRDTTADPRTRTNALVTGPENVRFYAGAQLRTSSGLPIGTLCVLSDEPKELTEVQKQALRTLADQVMHQLELRRLLRNQDILRSEIDHRVKNSLQTVQSLIRLYASKVTDTTSRDAFEAIHRRLDSIVMLHQELHNAQVVESVSLATYLDRIVGLLEQTLPDRISIRCDVPAVELTSSEATAVAVIVSEFVANAIKHAFPQGREGRISITAHRDDNDNVVLICADDGVGADTDAAAIDAVTSLGLRIMEASANQIGGQLKIDANSEGYRTTLTFTPVRVTQVTVQPSE